jgi:hypothetical protein
VYNNHNRKGKILSFQGKKQNEASLSGSNSTIFISKKHFWQKKLRTVMHTVKKSKMYLLIAREREEISQKIPTDLDSAGQNHFFYANVTILFDIVTFQYDMVTFQV